MNPFPSFPYPTKRLTPIAFACVATLIHAETKPNVIYIIADDLGYGDLSSYGQTKFSTPNIDAIAKAGMTFKQHYSAAHDPDYFNSNGGLRGYKRDLYEGGIRVPMVASWPGKIPAGCFTDHLSAFQDVLPTMADVVGQGAPVGIDGISLLPTLLQRGTQRQHDYLYWEFHEKKGRVAIRKENWKGVRYNVSIDPNSPLELYDLAVDPREEKNVANQHLDVVSELDGLIKNARTVSTIGKFNFPKEQDEPESARADEK